MKPAETYDSSSTRPRCDASCDKPLPYGLSVTVECLAHFGKGKPRAIELYRSSDLVVCHRCQPHRDTARLEMLAHGRSMAFEAPREFVDR